MVTEPENGNESEKEGGAVEAVPAQAAAEHRPARPPAFEERPARSEGGYARGGGGAPDDRPKHRGGGRRRRVCIMCADKIKVVDYKNVSFLRRFISDRARIETRRKSSACAKHQRAVARAIKRARHLALLPYSPEHLRGAQVGHR